MTKSALKAPLLTMLDGYKIPALGFGVYAISNSQTAWCVEKALETGYRLVDTAELYGNEKEACEGIAAFLKAHPEVKRDEITYTSKIWDSDFGYEAASRQVRRSAADATSIGNIDLYLMHSSGGGKQKRLETWRALQEAVDAGLVRSLGVSNWGIKHIEELLEWPGLKYKPVVNQIEVNPWKRHSHDIVPFCHEKGIIVEGYSPLTMGYRLEDPSLEAMAKKYHKTPAQVLLRWLVQHGVVGVPKTTSPKRMVENLSIFDFKLSPEDFESLGDPNAYFMAQPGWDPTRWP